MEQIKTTDNKELAWVNSLKFVCIIFIFYYHSDVYCSGKGDVGNEIYYFAPFYTNLFFFLSGYLLFKKQWNAPLISMGRKEWYNFNKSGGGRVFLHNIVFKIAIPTLFFSLLYFFPKTVLRGEGFSSVALIEQTFLGGAIWFTSALTVAELVIFVLLLLRSNSSLLWIIIGVMLMCISNFISHEHFQLFGSDDLPWFYKSGFISVAFMIVGGIYWRVENRCGSVKFKLGGAILSLLIVVLTTYSLLSNGRDDLVKMITVPLSGGTINIYSFVWALFSFIPLIYFAKKFKGCKMTNWIGRHSLIFYFLCGGIPNVISIVFSKFVNTGSFWLPIVVFVLSFGIAIVVAIILDRYVPFLFDIRLLKKVSNDK